MIQLKRLVLDILKPHTPSVLEFSKLLAGQEGLRVKVRVQEVDERTETLVVVVEGAAIDFECLQAAISEFGASLHSIDEVEVESLPDTTE